MTLALPLDNIGGKKRKLAAWETDSLLYNLGLAGTQIQGQTYD